MNTSFFKKCFLAAFLLMALPASAEWFIPAYDVDNDGTINIVDVTTLIDLILTKDNSQGYDGDTNYDGKVNVADVTTLIDYLLQRESSQYFDPKYRPSYPEIVVPEGAEVYTVNDVSFAMVPVDTVDGNGNIVRKMSIGLTEVTNELWTAVMGNSPLPATLLNVPCLRWPVMSVGYYDCIAFIDSLNSLTGRQFRLPSRDEWLYAAHGALLYHQYQYAGSDDISEVGWIGSTSPGGSWLYVICPIATKAPNELGLYDMTGNVSEWITDTMPHYTPPVLEMRCAIGGGATSSGWKSILDNSIIEVPATDTDSFIGLRLAL